MQEKDTKVNGISDEKLMELKEKYTDLFIKVRRGVTYIFKYPTRPIWKKFKQGLADNKVVATDNLLLDCLVYPEQQVFSSNLEKDVAMCDLIANDFVKSIIGEEEEEGKKV